VSSKRLRLVCLGLLACAFTYVFPYQATLNNPNENVRFYMTVALVESGQYAIDGPRARWGWVNDAAVHDGHVYSVKAPGTSMLAVPGYFAYLHGSRALGHGFDRTTALWWCRMFASVLPTLAFAYWFWGFLERRRFAPALIVATWTSVLLGSLLYGYGMLLVSHTLSAVVAFVAFAYLYEVEQRERSGTPLGAAAAGLLAAATTWFEYPGLIASVVLTVHAWFALRSPKLWAAWLSGGVLPALAMMHFQWRAFGNPFTPGHLFVETAGFRAAHEQGLYGAVSPSWSALYGLLFDLGAGLFPLTPLTWFALPGFVVWWRQRRARAAAISCAALCVLTTLAIASMNNWRGGWTIGPRYLAVCLPFLGFAALHALDKLYHSRSSAPLWAAGLALGATLAACVASGIPSAYYPHLPPEFTRPLPQLFAVLIAHGYAPMNLGQVFGLWGTASMLPLGLCAALLCSLGVWVVPRPWRAPAGGVALLSAALWLWPLWLRPADEPGVQQAVAFVTRRFHPSGHDRAARLRAQLTATRSRDPEAWKRLEHTYRAEGRDREAADAARMR